MDFNHLFLIGITFVSWVGYVRGISKQVKEKHQLSMGAMGLPGTLTFLSFKYSTVIEYLKSDPSSMTIKIFIIMGILGIQLSLYKAELFPRKTETTPKE